MDEITDLVLTPFREIIEKANFAILNATGCEPMLEAAHSLLVEGKQVLEMVEPLCRKYFDEYGTTFSDVLRENEGIVSYRSVLNSLLREFDDYIETESFDNGKFSVLQDVVRDAGRKIYDVLIHMKMEVSLNLAGARRNTIDTSDVAPSPISLQARSKNTKAPSFTLKSRGLLSVMFETAFDLAATVPQRVSGSSYSKRLHDELQRLFLWGDSFQVPQGGLDKILVKSTELRLAVLSSLYELGKVIKDELLPMVGREFPLQTPLDAGELISQELSKEIETVLREVAVELGENEGKSGYEAISDNDSSSDCHSIIDDMAIYIDCLMDLAPSLENPFDDFEPSDGVSTKSPHIFAPITTEKLRLDPELKDVSKPEESSAVISEAKPPITKLGMAETEAFAHLSSFSAPLPILHEDSPQILPYNINKRNIVKPPNCETNFAKMAWDIHRDKWDNDLSTSIQYRDFFDSIKDLAKNLRILDSIVWSASGTLARYGIRDTQPEWDSASLQEIIGDYETTLEECVDLIEINFWYHGQGHFAHLEWNVLVQPRADYLLQEILLHSCKVLEIARPFELNILSKVKDHLTSMHVALGKEAHAGDGDLSQVQGVTIPNLEHELLKKPTKGQLILEIPSDIAMKIESASLQDRAELATMDYSNLQSLSDSFAFCYDRSTVHTNADWDIPVPSTRPISQYMNLLKCVWILKRMQDLLNTISKQSLWPSYINSLEDCLRFREELKLPTEILSQQPLKNFSICHGRLLKPPSTIEIRERLTKLFELPLQDDSETTKGCLQLFVQGESSLNNFRIILSKIAQIDKSRRPSNIVEEMDFNTTTTKLIPLYASKGSNGNNPVILLVSGKRLMRLPFQRMAHAFKFQQAITGYKPYESYNQNVMVAFKTNSQKEAFYETATLQLWLPKPLEGLAKIADNPYQRPYSAHTYQSGQSLVTKTLSSIWPRHRSTYFPASPHGLYNMDWGMQGQVDRLSQISSTRSSIAHSIASTSTSMSSGTSRGSWSRIPFSAPSSVARSVASTSTSMTSGTSWSTWSNSTLPPDAQVPSILPGSAAVRVRGIEFECDEDEIALDAPTGSPPHRIANNYLHIDNTTGVERQVLHDRAKSKRSPNEYQTRTNPRMKSNQAKPMLVLFVENQLKGTWSIVTIDVETDTRINPQRCNCSKPGERGQSCNISAIEHGDGNSDLVARRSELSSESPELGGNIASLTFKDANSTGSNTMSLHRISLMFPDSHARVAFSGQPNTCKCKNETQKELVNCLKQGHRGLWGEFQESCRRLMSQ